MRGKPDSYKPISGNDLPRFAGIATFMRLPYVAPAEADEVDIGLIGVPWDAGTGRARFETCRRWRATCTTPPEFDRSTCAIAPISVTRRSIRST